MAGHSKWKNIKHKKAAVDALKAKRFTKLLKEITISAKQHGADFSINPTLRTLIEKANEINMPKDNYQRAVKRGIGELENVNYEEHLYEGYGPHGIAIIITVLTDNKNRAASEIRTTFQRNNGNLAEAGSVLWMFEKKSFFNAISMHNNWTENTLLEIFLDADIIDISFVDNELTIISETHSIKLIEKILKDNEFKIQEIDFGYYSKNKLSLTEEEEEESLANLLSSIESLDDVQNVYTNLE